ncbi:hypothetical protein [Microlunatus phosphovorus]|nr:hypothetical protein [Microlunatus phosphovorus]
MSSRDAAARMLDLATLGLPTSQHEWGRAMRAELSAIENTRDRRRFATSVARVTVFTSVGGQLVVAVLIGLLVAVLTLLTSRHQLGDPSAVGVVTTTVPIPALFLPTFAMAAAALARSYTVGVRAGLIGGVVCLIAVSGVLAFEGMVWIGQRGIFPLDADPPRTSIGPSEAALDIFITGMWIGHLIIWLSAIVVAAGVGVGIARMASPQTLTAEKARRTS